MKEKFERLSKNEKIVINVRSQKQYDDFMKMCEEQGLKWGSGNLATTRNFYYNDYKENTCINLNNLKELYFCDINRYKNDGYKIITYKDFIKEESIQFTKSDLKDNHILKLLNGDYVVMKQLCDVNNITNSLEHKRYKDWQINEVYEFDKLVWKREEKPVEILDKVEKKWLKNFIKSTEIKVNYIVKYDVSYYNDREYLEIYYNINGNVESAIFPYFKEDTMYKGMEVNKAYTLKELGLDK